MTAVLLSFPVLIVKTSGHFTYRLGAATSKKKSDLDLLCPCFEPRKHYVTSEVLHKHWNWRQP